MLIPERLPAFNVLLQAQLYYMYDAAPFASADICSLLLLL